MIGQGLRRILVSGLGGGLDIVNASLLYFAALREGVDAVLGSIRPAPQDRISHHQPFADSGTLINVNSSIDYGKGIGVARYCEPKVSKHIGKDVLFMSRKYQNSNDVSRLREAIEKARDKYDFEGMFFVDGGGDSLTFLADDADGTSENKGDPFAGGDSISLQALAGVKSAYLAVISVGLDISETAFKKNIQIMKERNAYYGRVNLLTGEEDGYSLEHLISFKSGFLNPYFKLAQSIVAINDEEDKAKSHTAVVTYHALKGNFGMQRTYVPWEPPGGVLVKPEHCWMYFFDASKIHEIKLELNNKSTKEP